MQVVEDVKEHILRFFFSRQELNVVDDQYVDHLVEMHKIVLVVISDGFNFMISSNM